MIRNSGVSCAPSIRGCAISAASCGPLLGVVLGAGLLPAGVVTHRVYLPSAGVVIVELSLVWAVVSWRYARIRPARSRAGTKPATGTKRRPGQTRRARMMQRMEQRWRRREGNGGQPPCSAT
jgi:hypothetical protein